MKLTKKVARLIDRERVCRVATCGVAGVPHLVPVCPVVAGGKIYFGSGDDGRKVKNLRENPHVTVTVDLYTEEWDLLKGVMVQGTARLIERGPRFRAVRDRLYAKYSQYRSDAALSPSDSVIVEVVPGRVFTWGLG
ncbi:MAG: pyridoxamine 5'-phosphate oxidase family protein [Candidatus Rokubacteria bacterium]|nr:pyridoxamine 5'-phosphate oxidase family protein [Candidatus Rokubacteria bacterium]